VVRDLTRPRRSRVGILAGPSVVSERVSDNDCSGVKLLLAP